jgi:hypothetical protein
VRNFKVTLFGRAYTEVEVEADNEDQARRKAELWARGKSASELNHIDIEGGWEADEADEVPSGG